MIQIRKLREFLPRGETEPKRYDRNFNPDIVTATTRELFEKHAELIATIEEKERYNLFYTISHTTGGESRIFQSQDVMPFDIDNILVDTHGSFDPRYQTALADALKTKNFTLVFSGNGLQVLVQLASPITTLKYFVDERNYYKVICANIDANLRAVSLPGETDVSAFAGNRLFRVPGSKNIKPGKPERISRIVQLDFTPIEFDLRTVAGLPFVKEDEQFTERQMTFVATDDEAVQKGCEFLKWSKENQQDVNEPQWYAMLSVIGRLEDGKTLAHEYSSGSPHYNERTTDRKLEQSLSASGPRTCANINHLWGECHTCPHFQKITSPILIKGENFIATEKSGFYMLGQRGALIPQYEDLRRFFAREHSYKTNADSGMVYVFDKTHYKPFRELRLKNFAHENFDPHPADKLASEFCNWVARTNHVEVDWFIDTTLGKINFQNGVLDLETGKLLEHSADYGFQYCLPFDFDKNAKSPHFDRFLDSVTNKDRDLQETLLEFPGYALCDRGYWLQKGLLLVGDGSNGKSTYLEVIQELTGKENYSSLSFGEMQDETGRASLEGKLLNIADELPNYSLKNTELFKRMMGGVITARRLYENGVSFKNTAKFIFACNEIPSTNDATDGLFRRLMIVPFNQKFRPGDGTHDAHIMEKMRPELPGIFNRVLKAYKDLKKVGQFTEGSQSKSELNQYREQVDRVGSWIRDNLKIEAMIPKGENPGAHAEVDLVYERYVSECRGSEERPTTRYYFTRHLKRLIPQFQDRYDRIRKGSRRPYVLLGVRLWDHDKKPQGKADSEPGMPTPIESDPGKDMPRPF
jgi:P4 family phage/plasmid primase-like protien